MDTFITNVLDEAAHKSDRYQSISDATSQVASDILDEYRTQPWDITGGVISVDISTEEVFISRWNR